MYMGPGELGPGPLARPVDIVTLEVLATPGPTDTPGGSGAEELPGAALRPRLNAEATVPFTCTRAPRIGRPVSAAVTVPPIDDVPTGTIRTVGICCGSG